MTWQKDMKPSTGGLVRLSAVTLLGWDPMIPPNDNWEQEVIWLNAQVDRVLALEIVTLPCGSSAWYFKVDLLLLLILFFPFE